MQEALTQPTLLSGREPIGGSSFLSALHVSETGGWLTTPGTTTCLHRQTHLTPPRPESQSLETNSSGVKSLTDSAEWVTRPFLGRQLL